MTTTAIDEIGRIIVVLMNWSFDKGLLLYDDKRNDKQNKEYAINGIKSRQHRCDSMTLRIPDMP